MKNGNFSFQRNELDSDLENFAERLGRLYDHIAGSTAPVELGGRMMVGFKPLSIVSDKEYSRRLRLADESDSLAAEAWKSLDQLAAKIRQVMPGALDEPIYSSSGMK